MIHLAHNNIPFKSQLNLEIQDTLENITNVTLQFRTAFYRIGVKKDWLCSIWEDHNFYEIAFEQ